MPVLTGPLAQHPSLQRQALVNVEVAVPPQRAKYRLLGGFPGSIKMTVPGLIDTGAGITCIDPRVRRTLNLTPFNRIPALTPSSGPNPPPSYLYKVDLTIVHPGGHPPLNLVRNLLTVVEVNMSHLGTDVLVGCDVLAGCLFVYDGQAGHFSLAY